MLTSGTNVTGGRLLSILAGSLVLLPVCVLRAPLTPRASGAADVDTAWFLSLPYRLAQGEVAGRDFEHSYGVLAQGLALLGTRLHVQEGSPLDALPLIHLAFCSGNVLLLGLTLSLVPRLGAGRAALILCVAGLLNIPFFFAHVRPLFAVLHAVVLGRALGAPGPWRAAGAVLCGLLGVAGLLLALDVGVYGAAGTALAVAGAAWTGGAHPGGRECLRFLGVAWGVQGVGTLAVSALYAATAAGPRGVLDFLRYGAELVRGHALALPHQEQVSWWALAVAAAVLLWGVTGAVAHARAARTPPGPRPGAFVGLALAAFAVVSVKGALLRSDSGHVVLGFIPAVLLFLLPGREGERRVERGAWAALLALLLWQWPWATPAFPSGVLRVLTAPGVLPERIARMRTQRAPVARLIPPGLESAVGELVVHFPYENHLTVALGRRLGGNVLQASGAHTEGLQRRFVHGLDAGGADLRVVYGLDGIASDPIDGVPNASRAPIIFEHLLRSFEPADPRVFGTGFLVLRPRSEPRTLPFRPILAGLPRAGVPVVLRSSSPTRCAAVRLSLQVDYPLIRHLTRPERLEARFVLGGALVHQAVLVPLAVSTPFTTLVSLVEPAASALLFSGEPVDGLEWDTLELHAQDTSPLGVGASRIVLQGVDCLDLGARQCLETATSRPGAQLLAGWLPPELGGRWTRPVAAARLGVPRAAHLELRLRGVNHEDGPVSFRVAAADGPFHRPEVQPGPFEVRVPFEGPTDAAQALVRIERVPGFRPREHGLPDDRELGVFLTSLCLVAPEGE